MRSQNVLLNTGVVVPRIGAGFLGSCFAFRYPSVFLTAAHCVREHAVDGLAIELPTASRRHDVTQVLTHPKADLAVLTVPSVGENDVTWLQDSLIDDRFWGEQIASCGYPEDYRSGTSVPTARLFQGYIQRFFVHQSHLGYNYLAAEMSVGAPRGLSGAPVFNARFHGRLYGVVAENTRTVTDVETVLEVEEGATKYREVSHSVINYGIAVWLPAIAEWIDSVVAPVSNEEVTRRALNQQRLRAAGLDR